MVEFRQLMETCTSSRPGFRFITAIIGHGLNPVECLELMSVTSWRRRRCYWMQEGQLLPKRLSLTLIGCDSNFTCVRFR